MITRREVAVGGLLTIVFGTGLGCACAHAAGENTAPADGCMIPESAVDALLGSDREAPVYLSGSNPRMLPSSGDRDFDFALAMTLSKLTDIFGVLPGFRYFDDSRAPNALATTRQLAARSDGTVLFGLTYLKRAMRWPQHPDAAVAAICAHEFAHIMQFKNDIHLRLRDGQSTVKRVELHADFLSGYFAGLRKRARPDFPAQVFVDWSRNVGDYQTHHRNHHGTPRQRAEAAVRGFETAYRDRLAFSEAVEKGIRWAETM
ncbi:MAG: metalloprotease [Hyphomicrobiaceae bacterium]